MKEDDRKDRWVEFTRRDRTAWLVVGAVGVAAISIATGYSVTRIERDLEQRTRDALEERGVDTSEVEVDFAYRSGTVTGLSDGETVTALAGWDGVEGTRVVSITADRDPSFDELDDIDTGLAEDAPSDDAATTQPPAETEATTVESEAATTDGPVATDTPVSDAIAESTERASVRVTVDIAADAVMLTGVVATEAQRTALVTAASERVGSDQVTDRLTLSETSTPGPLDGLTSLINALPEGVTGAAALDGDELVFTGTAPTSDAADEVTELLDGIERDSRVELDIVEPVDPVDAAETEPEPEPDPEPDSDAQPEPDTDAEADDADTESDVDEPALSADATELQTALDDLAPNIAENVVFGSSSDDLDAAATAALDDVVELLEQYPNNVVIVTGHTDDRGPEDTNEKLSSSRAEAVVGYLASQGISRDRMLFVGAGESQPIADNSTSEGQRQNRRVEFTALDRF